jgi:single-stranded-DNA-specific exonuclease
MNIKVNYQREIYIPEWLKKELAGDTLLASILLQRGINTPETVKEFLDPEFYKPTSPYAFPDMNQAVALILEAVKSGKKICIYGDYDVDGVTSTVILKELINKIKGQAIYHLPDRFKEGYGLNKGIIKKLASEVELIITCDCGISNYEEIAFAKELGLRVIVTDHHHLPPELPPADVILSPKLLNEGHQAYDIPGAGMAYFLAVALLTKLGRQEESKEFLDLLSLAIVADVVPLLGENRYFLQLGIPLLTKTKRAGLIELFKNAGIDDFNRITEEDIAYRVAPQINSAGRVLKADLAAQLLLAEGEFQARKYASEIGALNERRKKLQDVVIEEVLEILGENPERQPVVLYRPNWNEGVIGIAAGRLAEDLQVPVLLMCQKEDSQTVTGSARSIPGIHIYNELQKCEKYLIKYGGHAGAAGFSLYRDKLTSFRKNIFKILTEEVNKTGRGKVINIDGELPLDQVNLQDYYNLRRLAPFGEQNPRPRFLARNTEVIYSRATTDSKHLRLIVGQNGVQYPAIWWWAGVKDLDNRIDLIYSLDINDFQGKQELQLVVEEVLNRTDQTEEVVREDKGVPYELLDYRNWKEKGEELPVFKDAAYYYEGLDKHQGPETINRYQLTNKETLVLLTCPPSIEVFRELIYANRPSRVVLAFSRADITDGKTFLKQLTGLVKYAVNNKNGQLDVYQLAALTGQLESTITAALQYLEARGFISLNIFNPRYYLVRSGDGKGEREKQLKFKELKGLLQETKSFNKYFLKIRPGEIITITERYYK